MLDDLSYMPRAIQQMTQVWALIAQKGGVGKSTVATHVSIALTQSGRTVEVFDTDPQQTMAKWSRTRKGKPPAILAVTTAQLSNALADARRRQVDIVIIDTAGKAERESLIIARYADMLIIPVRPTMFDIPAIEDTIQLLRGVGLVERAVTVLNAIANTSEGSEAVSVVESLGPTLCPYKLSERVGYRRSLTVGKGVTEAYKKTKETTEIGNLTKWLLKQGLARTPQEAEHGQVQSAKVRT